MNDTIHPDGSGGFETGSFRESKAKVELSAEIRLKALIVKGKILNRGKKSLISISKELNIPYQYARDISCGRILKER